MAKKIEGYIRGMAKGAQPVEIRHAREPVRKSRMAVPVNVRFGGNAASRPIGKRSPTRFSGS
jgi:hypothetical protein